MGGGGRRGRGGGAVVGGVGGGGGGRPSLGRARLRHRGRPMAELFQARPPTPRNTRPYTPPPPSVT